VEQAVDIERELTYRELLIDKVLLNKYVWLLAMANFFAYITRYSMLDWGPTYLREAKGGTLDSGWFGQMVMEFGGIPTTIFFGWVSDRLAGRRGMVASALTRGSLTRRPWRGFRPMSPFCTRSSRQHKSTTTS
jgi:OPA family glycerol-3-phosphate transporter-like MFS transporter